VNPRNHTILAIADQLSIADHRAIQAGAIAVNEVNRARHSRAMATRRMGKYVMSKEHCAKFSDPDRQRSYSATAPSRQ